MDDSIEETVKNLLSYAPAKLKSSLDAEVNRRKSDVKMSIGGVSQDSSNLNIDEEATPFIDL